MKRRDDIDVVAEEVLAYLESHSYDDTAAHFDTSRGKVYSLAIAARRHMRDVLLREQSRLRCVHRDSSGVLP